MSSANDETYEAEWLRAAANNPAFASLADPEEDIYSLNDGEPFVDSMSSEADVRSEPR